MSTYKRLDFFFLGFLLSVAPWVVYGGVSRNMQDHSPQSFTSGSNGLNRNAQGTAPGGGAALPGSVDELARVFNTALLSTRGQNPGAPTNLSELQSLMESPPFRAILGAIRQLSRLNGISERQAAEQVIRTFRRADQIWTDYVFQEGLDRIKNQGIRG